MTVTDLPVVCNFSKRKETPVFVLPTLGQHLKRIYGSTFIRGKGLWLFPAYYPIFKDVVRDIKLVVPNVQFSDKAKEHIEAMQKLDRLVTSGGLNYRDDFTFVTQPYAHQEEALKFALAFPRCGIFYDMGLGKTKVAIDLIRHEQQKTLVLVPSVGTDIWVREIAFHSGGELRAIALSGTPAKRKKLLKDTRDVDVLIVSYDTAKREHDRLIKDFPYRIIIADESHFLRGYKSARTKCAHSLASQAYRRIIMSGTPSLGNPLHLWGQLAFLAPYLPAKDFWTFRNRYCIVGTTAGYYLPEKVRRNMIVGFKNLDQLNAKVQKISIRKKKEDCLDLPERTIQDIYFDIEGDQRKAYNDLVENIAIEIEQAEDVLQPDNAAIAIQKLLQVLSGFFIVPLPNICDGCKHVAACVEEGAKPYTKRCHVKQKPPPQRIHDLKANPKLRALEELLESILAEDRNKCIIWAWYRHELFMIENLLQQKEIKYLRIDGSNSSKGPEYAQKFDEDPSIRIWLAQVNTGVALTLTAASYMVYYNLPYDLGAYQQAMDRNYRIGQKRPVFVYRLLCKGSVLEYVARTLSQKRNIADTLTDDIKCAICEKSLFCVAQGIRPFSEECVYQSKTARVRIRPKIL